MLGSGVVEIFSEVFACGGAIGFVGLFFGGEASEMGQLSVYADHCAPTAVLHILNAAKSAGVVLEKISVATLLGVCCLSQVFPAIVIRFPIAMIDCVCWPSSGLDQPCQCRSRIEGLTYTYAPATTINVTGLPTFDHVLVKSDLPSKERPSANKVRRLLNYDPLTGALSCSGPLVRNRVHRLRRREPGGVSTVLQRCAWCLSDGHRPAKFARIAVLLADGFD